MALGATRRAMKTALINMAYQVSCQTKLDVQFSS